MHKTSFYFSRDALNTWQAVRLDVCWYEKSHPSKRCPQSEGITEWLKHSDRMCMCRAHQSLARESLEHSGVPISRLLETLSLDWHGTSLPGHLLVPTLKRSKTSQNAPCQLQGGPCSQAHALQVLHPTSWPQPHTHTSQF